MAHRREAVAPGTWWPWLLADTCCSRAPVWPIIGMSDFSYSSDSAKWSFPAIRSHFDRHAHQIPGPKCSGGETKMGPLDAQLPSRFSPAVGPFSSSGTAHQALSGVADLRGLCWSLR